MKHTFQWILAVVCLFVVGTVRVMADDGEDVKVELQSGTKITQGAVLKINNL